MIPVTKGTQASRDWMMIGTVLVWTTIIAIMFLSKLKAAQDFLVCGIMLICVLIANADHIFSGFRWYKIFVVLRVSIQLDCACAITVTGGCLILHALWPDSCLPGVAMHLLAFGMWVFCEFQATPFVSYGLYVGGKNFMTKVQLFLRFGAQIAGMALALLIFALVYSFKFPGLDPFNHFLGWESLLGAVASWFASMVLKSQSNKKLEAKKA